MAKRKPVKSKAVTPSRQALALLAGEPATAADQTAAKLPSIRETLRHERAASARKAIRRNGVETREIEIGDVACLEIMPPKRTDERTILYFFGGGYTVGSPLEDMAIIAPLAAGTGARIVAPCYRLAPEHPYPAALDDGQAVYRALTDAAPAGSLAIVGESAGGGLALSVMNRAARTGGLYAAAVALMSPWCDLSELGTSVDTGLDPTLTRDHLEQAAAHYAAGARLKAPDTSPIYAEYDGDYPPVLITTGTHDGLLSQGSRLARVLRIAGVEVDLRVWDSVCHVFEWYDDLPEADASLNEIAAFLDAQFL